MATVTSLDREIAREERRAGMPADQPLTDVSIAHRQIQIATVLGACGFVALVAAFAAAGTVRVLAVALACSFGVYAIEKDRHLRRLTLLRDDSQRITLVVAGELMYSGALDGDRELLDLREAMARAAGRLAATLADVVTADCTRVRLLGPSGEVPVAAERDVTARFPVADDPAAAAEVVRGQKPIRQVTTDGHSILVVPVWRGRDMVALLEAVGTSGTRYMPRDAATVDAFARGAVAALLSPGLR